MSDFFQDGPKLSSAMVTDSLFRTYLKLSFSAKVWAEIEPDLIRFSEMASGPMMELANQAEAQPPVLRHYDAWGRRVDEILVSNAWTQLHDVAAREGIVAAGYERTFADLSRVYQMAKLFIFHPSSAMVSCPLAMTDGAARALELYGDRDLKQNALRRLISRDPKEFWTSGQWMTERTGGSDVSATSTRAERQESGWRLFGDKWFTSATTAQMTMTLARTGEVSEGSAGLSLFYVELRDSAGLLKNIEVNRLKDKLGTRALPTAELSLKGTPAVLVGGLGGGVKRIASILNITRIYNSICAIAQMQRALFLAKDYARRRRAFGLELSRQPLHSLTLAQAQVLYEGCFHLGFFTARLLGKEESGMATEGELILLRLLTPIVKLWTGKAVVSVTSEMLESFGGAGYVEDTGLPRLLRDAQVLPIWEGTTNVLSLDVLKVAQKTPALSEFFLRVDQKLSDLPAGFMVNSVAQVQAAQVVLKAYAQSKLDAAAGARWFAFSLARVFAASLLLEFAAQCAAQNVRPASQAIAKAWCETELAQITMGAPSAMAASEIVDA